MQEADTLIPPVDRVFFGVTTRTMAVAAAASLVLFLWLQLYRHDMWRDELQAWWLAADSANPAVLWQNVRYEGHPALWYGLLWLVSRVSSDVGGLKVVHGVIAAAIVYAIVFRSPFSAVEKILACLGYFVIFQYTVISRNYGIGFLLALIYAQLYSRNRLAATGALVLGLLANTNIYCTILSLCLAADVLFGGRRVLGKSKSGLALYGALLLFAVATVIPPSDRSHDAALNWVFRLDVERAKAVMPFLTALGTAETSDMARAVLTKIAGIPAWVPVAILDLLRATSLAALGLSLLVFWKDYRLFLIYSGTAAGSAVFSYIIYPPSSRHVGIVAVAFLSCYWMLIRQSGRSLLAPAVLAASIVPALLVTIDSFERPFSNAYSTAQWISRNVPRSGMVIVTPDVEGSAIGGYLGRPVYFLECNCTGRYVKFNLRREFFQPWEMGARLQTAILTSGTKEAYVVIGGRVLQRSDLEASVPSGYVIQQMAAFEGSVVSEEDFAVFRLSEGT